MKISPQLLEVVARKPAPDPALVRAWETGAIATRPARLCNRAQRRHEGYVVRRRYQRSPDREKSLQRRRWLAATGCLPPTMAAHLTTAEQAVARILLNEILANRTCTLHMDRIAAQAGVAGKTAQRTLRRLSGGKDSRCEKIIGLNWITVEFRKVGGGRRNDTNVVTIVSKEWLAWIGRRRNSAGHFGPTTNTIIDDGDGGGAQRESGTTDEARSFAAELANIAGYRRDAVPQAWIDANPSRLVQGWLDDYRSVGMGVTELRAICTWVMRRKPEGKPYSPRYFTPEVRRVIDRARAPLGGVAA